MLADWRDTPLWVVGSAALLVLGVVMFSTARRALRRASERIDTIFTEELRETPSAAVHSLADHREPLVERRVSGAVPPRR
ncbi:MAG: hypothetical protein ACRDSK_20575 [Actinophytocola sp.]|uniref:hypothetical protein n=1 Tax=Actinophytocola sp. TaxID=1872138 RepID=UPI003D6A0A90